MLPASENLRHFHWLMIHASLPTNAFRGLRHFCGAFVESDHMHTLHDYHRERNIWRHLNPTYPNDFYIQDCQIWLKKSRC
jgi:hypothetical protein